MKWQLVIWLASWAVLGAQGQFRQQAAQRGGAGPAMARPRWPPTRPLYKPHYMYVKGPPGYRVQKPFVKMPNMYSGGAVWKAPLTYRPSPLKDMYNRSPSAALMASSTSQLLGSSPQSLNFISNQLAPAQHTLQITPSHNIQFNQLSATHNLIPGQATSHKFVASYSKPKINLLSHSTPVYSFVGGPISQQTSSQLSQSHGIVGGSSGQQGYGIAQSHGVSHSSAALAGPPVQTRPVMYPIRVDGEGGPIHTIPAPNLSLADKPIIVPDNSNNIESYSPYFQNQVRGSNTYEVTEDSHDKSFHDQSTGQNQVYGTTQEFGSKLVPTRSHYTHKNTFVPQTSALRSQETQQQQSAVSSLTSQELFRLLQGGPAQQQLADTYTLPLLQQPQLQQHFMQQNLDAGSLQPFNAILQPVNDGNIQQSLLFKPDPRYVQKIQEQFLKHSNFQPNYQTFNYVEPGSQVASPGQEVEAIRAEFEEASNGDEEASKLHYNVVRNTNEGSPQSLGFHQSENNLTNNVIEDSDTSASFNVESKVNFVTPDAESSQAKGFGRINPMTASYFSQIDNVDNGGVSTGYLASLADTNLAETLASLQAADNLIQMANGPQKSTLDYAANLNPYFIQNTVPETNVYPSYVRQDNNAFTPIKGSPFSVNQHQLINQQAPIRIFVPDQYEDIEVQPSENIHVSASLNTNESGEDNEHKRFDNEEEQEESFMHQDYDDYSHFQIADYSESNTTSSSIDGLTMSPVEYTTNADDVIVTVDKNVTHPTLDILTKDWKTSIAIKPKSEDKINPISGINQISEFGSRIRPKRDE